MSRFRFRDYLDGTAAIAVVWLAFLLIMLGRLKRGDESIATAGPVASAAAATPAAP